MALADGLYMMKTWQQALNSGWGKLRDEPVGLYNNDPYEAFLNKRMTDEFGGKFIYVIDGNYRGIDDTWTITPGMVYGQDEIIDKILEKYNDAPEV
jgi:hypothetical protein